MSVEVHNITLYQASDARAEVFLFNEDKSPIDLSGMSLRMQVRERRDALASIVFSFTSDPGGGLTFDSAAHPDVPGPAPAFPNGIVLTIPAARTVNVRASRYAYDLFIDGPTTSELLLVGTLTIMGTVTRAA